MNQFNVSGMHIPWCVTRRHISIGALMGLRLPFTFSPSSSAMVIKTPSLYSQDDPLAEALKPPSFETDAERYARLQAEAEAKRISEQIDEDLRQERERLRRKRADVKVSSSERG